MLKLLRTSARSVTNTVMLGLEYTTFQIKMLLEDGKIAVGDLANHLGIGYKP